MRTLRATIEDLANEFAMSIISALREASIEELTNVAGIGRARSSSRPGALDLGGGRRRGRGARLGRRSVQDISRMVDSIVALLGKHPDGMRAEEIREALACQAKELPRPLADGVTEGRISKTGQKRATTYFASEESDATNGGAAKRRARARRNRA